MHVECANPKAPPLPPPVHRKGDGSQEGAHRLRQGSPELLCGLGGGGAGPPPPFPPNGSFIVVPLWFPLHITKRGVPSKKPHHFGVPGGCPSKPTKEGASKHNTPSCLSYGEQFHDLGVKFEVTTLVLSLQMPCFRCWNYCICFHCFSGPPKIVGVLLVSL